MKNLSDESLVTLFAQGQNEAFDELLYRYKDNLFSYIIGIVLNKEVAEDLFQDTFTKVIVNLKSGSYTESGKFSSYLFRVAHNAVIDYLRVQQNAPLLKESDVEYDLMATYSDGEQLLDECFEDSISRRQLLAEVRKMIQFLPDNQREILIMRFYKNMSFKDIADELGVGINTALGRVRYAVRNMRKLADQHHITLAL